MSFLKNMKVKGQFKKGYLVDTSEMPSQKERDRFLANYAVENDIPIVVSKQIRVKELQFANPKVQILRLASNFTIEVKHFNPSSVLIDETVSIEMITWLRDEGIEVRGGFN